MYIYDINKIYFLAITTTNARFAWFTNRIWHIHIMNFFSKNKKKNDIQSNLSKNVKHWEDKKKK